MAIAIYQAVQDGRHHWAESTSPDTMRRLRSGEWLVFDDTPDTPSPVADPLDRAIATRIQDQASATAAQLRSAVRGQGVFGYQGLTPTGAGNLRVAEENVGSTAMFTRAAVRLTEGLHTVRLRYVAWAVSAAVDGHSSEELSAQPVQYAAALETVGGRVIPLTVAGSSLFSVTSSVDTDPIDVDIPAGDGIVYVRTYATVAQGGFIPCPIQCSSLPGESQVQLYNANPGQATGTGPIVNAPVGGGLGCGPIAMLNSSSKRGRVVAIVGDSIAAGYGDLPSATRGYLDLAMRTSGSVSYLQLSRGGERAVEWGSTPSAHPRRGAMLLGCTDAVHEYGTNDVATMGVLANVQAALVKSWTMLAGRGLRTTQTTILPRGSSSDGWRTTTGQTPSSTEPVRVAVNDWLRDGAPIAAGVAVATGTSPAGVLRAGTAGHPLAQVLEVADAVESARNSGRWKAAPVTGTGDTTNGSNTVANLTGSWRVGDAIVGPGLGANNWLTAVTGNTGTLANSASATATGAAVFSPMTNDGTHPTSRGVLAASQAPDLTAYLATLSG